MSIALRIPGLYSSPDLTQLRGLIAEMGGLAEQAIIDAIKALRRGDRALAEEVRERDARIDALEVRIEKIALRLMVQAGGREDTLREIVAALKIAAAVERVGDYAKNIAKRVPLIDVAEDIEPLTILPAMARLATEQLHDVLDAFAARDAEKAHEVRRRDAALDDFYNSLFRSIMAYMTGNPDTIGHSAHLLFVAKNLERIGDHVTNIAEMVYLAATGTPLPDRAKGADAIG